MVQRLRARIGLGAVLAAVCLASFVAARPAAAAGLVALSIGVADYDKPLNKLDYTAKDAETMSGLLADFGFQSYLLLNPDVDQFQRGITEFLSRAKGADAAVLYYSGHGLQINGNNYFIPRGSDFQSEDDFRRVLLTVNSVLESLDESKARFKFIIMDACRDNPFLSDPGIKFPAGLAELYSLRENTMITFASAPGQTSVELKTLQHGLYSGELAQVLKASDRIEARSLTEKTRDLVLKFEEQNPQVGSQIPWETNSMRGPFFFARAAAPKVTALMPETPEPSKEFILPDSSRQKIRPEELAALSPGELRIARNEIYARKGRIFVSADLKKYFSRFAWYHPVSAEVQLNPVEAANVEAILAAARGAPAEIAVDRPPDDFVFPDSDRRRLTAADLVGRAKAELQIARNEVFARHGRFFQTEAMKTHFAKLAWYRPYTWNPGLNEVEWANVTLIQQAERAR
jgi:hypothetical protein